MSGGPVLGSNSMYPPTSAPYPSGPPPGILPPMMSTMGPPPHIQVSLLLMSNSNEQIIFICQYGYICNYGAIC